MNYADLELTDTPLMPPKHSLSPLRRRPDPDLFWKDCDCSDSTCVFSPNSKLFSSCCTHLFDCSIHDFAEVELNMRRNMLHSSLNTPHQSTKMIRYIALVISFFVCLLSIIFIRALFSIPVTKKAFTLTSIYSWVFAPLPLDERDSISHMCD